MSRIAVLDTGICPKHLRCKSFASYKICEDGNAPEETSHGTLCARVLDDLAEDYELISIQILPNQGGNKRKSLGKIEHFRKGLELCLELQTDLVCMSAVSSVLSDSAYLYDAAKKLAAQSVLLAALDNRRFLTVPTAYPFVLGVQSDWANLLSPGELAYEKEDPYFANVYANCEISSLRRLHCAPSNSFAVPAAAAKVNQWLHEKRDIEEAVCSLRAYPVTQKWKGAASGWKQEPGREIPLVWMHGQDEKRVYEVCRSVMDELYGRYQIQASGLVSKTFGYDVRLRELSDGQNLKEVVQFMEHHYKTDLIFLLAGREQVERDVPNQDVTVQICGHQVRITYEKQCSECGVETLAEEIYLALRP